MRVRLGLGGGPPLRPNQIAGYGIMGLGGLILILSLPFYFWAAAFGGLLGYLGWTVTRLK